MRIRGDQLRARDGRYELRVTNELEETLFLDHLSLARCRSSGRHRRLPARGTGLGAGTRAPHRDAARPTRDRARVDRCVRPRRDAMPPRRTDRAFVDGLPLLPVRGYARPHALTVDLGPVDAGAGRRAAAHRVDRLRVLERQRRGLARGIRAAPAVAAGARRARRLADGDRGDRHSRRPPADRRGRPDRPVPLRPAARCASPRPCASTGIRSRWRRASTDARRRRPASPRRRADLRWRGFSRGHDAAASR